MTEGHSAIARIYTMSVEVADGGRSMSAVTDLTEEHETIKAELRHLVETLQSLQVKDQSNTDAYGSLQSIIWLRDGLLGHYEHEEAAMSEFLSGPMVEALVEEHQDIQRRFAEILKSKQHAGQVSSAELFSDQRDRTIAALVNLAGLIEAHSVREEAILHLARRAVEIASMGRTGVSPTGPSAADS